MGDIFYADLSFEINEFNPFDNYNLYNSNWVILRLVDDPNINIIVGSGKSNTYEVTISKYCRGWEYRILDFIHYNLKNKHNIICVMDNEDIAEIKQKYSDYSNDILIHKLRYYEPNVLIHSTLPEYTGLIKKSGSLKSWNKLKWEGVIQDKKPIGDFLGDPEEFRDYVMLGEGVSCEIVVLSKQLNRIEMNEDLPYKPGGRFYFDVKKIADDGLLVRDGIHYKVKDELPLDKYLLCLITPDDIEFNGSEITPRNFTCLADRYFERKFGISLG